MKAATTLTVELETVRKQRDGAGDPPGCHLQSHDTERQRNAPKRQPLNREIALSVHIDHPASLSADANELQHFGPFKRKTARAKIAQAANAGDMGDYRYFVKLGGLRYRLTQIA